MSKWKWATRENLRQDVGKQIVVTNGTLRVLAVGTLKRGATGCYSVDELFVIASDDVYAVFDDLFEPPAASLADKIEALGYVRSLDLPTGWWCKRDNPAIVYREDYLLKCAANWSRV